MRSDALPVATILVIAALGASAPAQTKTSAPPVSALVGGTLIDGHGGEPLRNSVILIEGERIKAIGQVGTLAVPPGAQVISTEGMSVLPGLWDMHVHLMLNGHAETARGAAGRSSGRRRSKGSSTTSTCVRTRRSSTIPRGVWGCRTPSPPTSSARSRIPSGSPTFR